MNFQEAEKTYRDLRAQHAAGRLNDAAFEAEAGKLRLQDAQGRWWQIGVQSGEWYMHDGQKWVKAKPPVAAPPPSVPAAAPEGAEAPKAEAATAPAAKPARPSVLPARLFSAKPAGRGGGLPTPVLIAIIAAVALFGIAVLVGGYFLISGQLGGIAAQPTATPTRAIAIQPSPVIPTLAPPVRATETPLLPPTPVVTETVPLPPTVAAPTPAVPRATATKKPVTPTGPAATATPNVPPGVYVTKLETDPQKPNVGDVIGFKVAFMNTTGSPQYYKWLVKVYQCPEQCGPDGFRNSHGESTRVDSTVNTGTVELVAPKHVNLGIGRCDYVAIPHYVDQTSQQVVPFMTTKGIPLYQTFKACQ